MFRHRGKSRTFKHNLYLAIILSLVAGVVNIAGVLSVSVLTTNVTGHFAYFAEHFFKGNYQVALMFLAYILCFLLGAFTSNFLIEIANTRKPKLAHAAPMLIEISILTACTFITTHTALAGNAVACLLLFAMGLQNALVTQVSQNIVRTTHLTGLFTDLGIELSQLFFYKKLEERYRLGKSIGLRFAIIFSFFAGCLAGGFLYQYFQVRALLFAVAMLLAALYYNNMRYYIYTLQRKASSI